MQAKPQGEAHFRVTANGIIVDYHAAGNMVGIRDARDVVGRHVADLAPPETAAAILGAVAECLTSNSVVEIHYMSATDDGQRAREARFTPIGNSEVLGIMSDVTERLTADSRRIHLAEILETSTDYVATTDANGQIMYANAAFRRRFGLEQADVDLHARNLFSFLTPDSRDKFLHEGVPELWRTGRWSSEIEAVDSDGVTIPLWQAAIAHLDADGTPEYFSGISRDITEMRIAQADLRNSEERFRALVAESSDVIVILDEQAEIKYASPAFARLLGYPEGSLVGTNGFNIIHPDDLEAAANAFLEAHTGQNSASGLQYRVRHFDGSWRWTETHTTNHLNTAGVNGYIVNARDITARHEANEKLEQTSDLLTSVMGAAGGEAIIVTDLTGTIVAFSRGAELLLGYSAEETLGKLNPTVFHIEEDLERLAAEIEATAGSMSVAQPDPAQSVEHEWIFVRRDGSRFDGMLSLNGRLDSSGNLCGFVALVRDVTEYRRQQAELTFQAHFDQLTGLANRAYLQVALAEAADDLSWSDPGRTMLFIDLDHFKQVNDTLGHAAGDAVLIGVATRLLENLRVIDLPARVGGDEFVVLLGPNMSMAVAAEVAQRIVEVLATPFKIVGTTVTIGASVGMATSDADTTPEDLLRAADIAVYSAKHAGRGRVFTSTS
jgi:diguanylate cyclase (GGDEF)-like protein/PAS domain S-box-containing protein